MVYKIKLKIGEFSTNHLQFYNSLGEIVGAVFGEKKAAPVKVNDMSPENAVQSLNDFFKMTGAS